MPLHPRGSGQSNGFLKKRMCITWGAKLEVDLWPAHGYILETGVSKTRREVRAARGKQGLEKGSSEFHINHTYCRCAWISTSLQSCYSNPSFSISDLKRTFRATMKWFSLSQARYTWPNFSLPREHLISKSLLVKCFLNRWKRWPHLRD